VSVSRWDRDWRMRRATFGVAVGERRAHGLGTEATRLVLDWAFNMLGLHDVILSVLPTNVGAISAYEKAGFQRVGVRRGAVLSLGALCDEI
jgi:diamine N-acetyltransferase